MEGEVGVGDRRDDEDERGLESCLTNFSNRTKSEHTCSTSAADADDDAAVVGEGVVMAAMEGGATSIPCKQVLPRMCHHGWKLVPDKTCEEVSVGKAAQDMMSQVQDDLPTTGSFS